MGLRGIAAFAVVTRHAPALFFRFHDLWIDSKYIWRPSCRRTPFESYLGVDFFFVLSGFVLEHAY